MREYLLQFMNEDAAMGVQFLIALIAVLILFGIFVWFLRLITGTQNKRRTVRPDQRLAVLDRTSVDDNRSLLLIQRDGVEHLLMVGGPSDVVVESNINLGNANNSAEHDPKPGHEIARRVIAQRPFRTMSLAGSSATVAESMGIVTSEAPEAAIAAPAKAGALAESAVSVEEPAEAKNLDVVATPLDTTATPQNTSPVAPLPVSDTAVKKIAEIISEPAPANVTVETPTPVAAVLSTQPIEQIVPPATIAAVPVPVTEPIQAASLPTAPAPAPAPAPELIIAQQTAQQQPAPQVQLEPQSPQYSNIAEEDLLANLEDALKIDVPPTSSRAPVEQPTSVGTPRQDIAEEQNHISRRQDIDLTSGFAAAMANSPPEQPLPDAGPTISDNFLEDALANALDVPHDTYADDKNTVYSPSESVPAGSEGQSTLRRTSHVDDEMNRLLNELATPNRG